MRGATHVRDEGHIGTEVSTLLAAARSPFAATVQLPRHIPIADRDGSSCDPLNRWVWRREWRPQLTPPRGCLAYESSVWPPAALATALVMGGGGGGGAAAAVRRIVDAVCKYKEVRSVLDDVRDGLGVR